MTTFYQTLAKIAIIVSLCSALGFGIGLGYKIFKIIAL